MKDHPQWIWHNGELVPWQDAQVHVMAHALHYGSSVFEGIRSYETSNGPAIFRLDEHLNRLFNSCKMYRMAAPFSHKEIKQACCDVVSKNGLAGSYIRPLVFRDALNLGLCPGLDDPVSCSVMAFEWGPLHGAEALEKGSDVCISSWKRLKSATNPVLSKAGGHYLTSQLISMEAKTNGYDEGIAVNDVGNLTEGAGANVFVVRQGKILTPGLGHGILEGITRDTVLAIATQLNYEVSETEIPRESLYAADEIFMCGTAAEIAPIRSIDRIEIGSGIPGPITREFQSEYKKCVTGQCDYAEQWLTFTSSSKSSPSDGHDEQLTGNQTTNA